MDQCSHGLYFPTLCAIFMFYDGQTTSSQSVGAIQFSKIPQII